MTLLAHLRCITAVVVGVAVPVAACGGPDCDSYLTQFQYSLSNPSSECEITVSGSSGSVVDDIAPTSETSCAEKPPCLTGCPCVECSAISGPAPLYCQRYDVDAVDTLYVQFLQPKTSSLATYTGSSTMTVSVVCGGIAIVNGATVTEECIHGE